MKTPFGKNTSNNINLIIKYRHVLSKIRQSADDQPSGFPV